MSDILLSPEDQAAAVVEGEKTWKALYDAAYQRHKEIIDKNLVGETVLYPNKEQVLYAALCCAQVRNVAKWLLKHAMGATPSGWILDDEAEAALKAAGEGK